MSFREAALSQRGWFDPTLYLNRFATNALNTSQYTNLNYLVRPFFEVILKPLNIYFIVTALLSSIRAISPLSTYANLIPLIYIISLTMIKIALNDLQRTKIDLILNSEQTLIWRNGAWREADWAEVRIGDVLKVLDGRQVPADLVMLGSSIVEWVPDDFRDLDNDGTDDALQGIAYFSISQIMGTGDLEKKIGVSQEVQ